MIIDRQLATKVALSCKILAMEGHGDITLGHVSARVESTEDIYMKPRGLGLEDILPDDVIVIDLDGEKVAGKRERHSEYPIHTEIYRLRSDVNCVIHTHPPYSTAFAASTQKLRPVSHEGVLFDEVPIFTNTTQLIVKQEQGSDLARTIGSHKAVLMRNHGIVVVGKSVEEATVYAVMLEKAARMQLITSSLGKYYWSSEDDVLQKNEQIYHNQNILNFWDYFVEKAKNASQLNL